MSLEQRRPAVGIAPFCHLEENTSMLRHARKGPTRCRTREAASIFPFRPQLPQTLRTLDLSFVKNEEGE
jgi:hypothetical protein